MLKKNVGGTLKRVTAGHEAIVLTDRGREVAALIPGDLPELLEDLEDIRDAEKALAEYRRNPASAVPWEQVKTEAAPA